MFLHIYSLHSYLSFLSLADTLLKGRMNYTFGVVSLYTNNARVKCMSNKHHACYMVHTPYTLSLNMCIIFPVKMLGFILANLGHPASKYLFYIAGQVNVAPCIANT